MSLDEKAEAFSISFGSKKEEKKLQIFSNFKGILFVDMGKNERARPFPSFSHGPHSKQKDVSML